jgi:hypothetical protein
MTGFLDHAQRELTEPERRKNKVDEIGQRVAAARSKQASAARGNKKSMLALLYGPYLGALQSAPIDSQSAPNYF